MFFAVLSRGVFAPKCTIFRTYVSHFSLDFAIICNSCFLKSLRCTPWCTAKTLGWRWSFGRSASAAPREMTWHQNWMSCTAFHDFSAGEPFYPFPDSKLFWQPSCAHSYPRMTCLVAAAESHNIKIEFWALYLIRSYNTKTPGKQVVVHLENEMLSIIAYQIERKIE